MLAFLSGKKVESVKMFRKICACATFADSFTPVVETILLQQLCMIVCVALSHPLLGTVQYKGRDRYMSTPGPGGIQNLIKNLTADFNMPCLFTHTYY